MQQGSVCYHVHLHRKAVLTCLVLLKTKSKKDNILKMMELYIFCLLFYLAGADEVTVGML